MFSRTAKYALRLMTFLAVHRSERVNALALAQAAGVPAAYVSKIMKTLSQAHLVRSRRGHSGGFVLARKPELIRMIHILRAMNEIVEPRDCVWGLERCGVGKERCLLHHRWTKLHDQVITWAWDTTLADVCSDNARVGSLEV